MTVVNKLARPEAAPALFRLLADSALSRAALDACGFPLAILDAESPERGVTYVNPAFEDLFGYRPGESLGRSLAKLVLRGDEALAKKLLGEPGSRWQIKVWSSDGTARHVEIALRPVRNTEGRLAHWVVAFSDRNEVERLRAELESLRSLASIP